VASLAPLPGLLVLVEPKTWRLMGRDAAAQGAKTAVGGVIGRIVEPFVSDASKLEVVAIATK